MKRPGITERERLRFIIPSFIAVAAFVLALFIVFLPRIRSIGVDKKKASIIDLVQLSVDVCDWMNSQAEAGKMTQDQARDSAAGVIKHLRYGTEGKDYFWIIDNTPVMIMHPYREELEGEYVGDYTDDGGVQVFAEMVKRAEEDGAGFVSYQWQLREQENIIGNKLSYVALFEPWDWIIGTGIYLDEIEAEIADLSNSMLIISLVVTLLVSVSLFILIRSGLTMHRQKRAASKALRESETRYRNLVQLMHEGVIIVDAEDRFSFVNQQFCVMMEVPEEKLIGSQVDAFIDDADRDIYHDQTRKRIAGQDAVYNINWRTGNRRKLSTIVSPRVLYTSTGSYNGSYAVVTDISELRQAEEGLRTLLKERTVLLKEIHHRVKNNLQMISSLLNLQYQNVSDERVRNILFDSQARIQTMSRVHESLYESENLQDISIPRFIEELLTDVKSVFCDTVCPMGFYTDIDDLMLPIDYALPCGLILNELLSNAIKYAFPSERPTPEEKRITIFFRDEATQIRLGVEDNGIGLPPGFNPLESKTLGFELVYILSQQLGAEIVLSDHSSRRGTRVTCTIPASSLKTFS